MSDSPADSHDDAIEQVVNQFAARPTKDTHRLMMELTKRVLGMGMYGTTIEDKTLGDSAHPDDNTDKMHLSPYFRPTAGTAVLPSYQTADGEIYLLLARGKQRDPETGKVRHDLPPNHHWQFAGGYMDSAPPEELLEQYQHDTDFDVAVARELQEETGLNASHATMDMLHLDQFVRFWGHHISANYLADFGICDKAPDITPDDDIADARWVNIRDIQRNPFAPDETAYQVTIDGKEWDLKSRHHPLLEKAVSRVRERLYPLYEPKALEGISQFDERAHALCEKIPLKHHSLGEWTDRIAQMNDHTLETVRQAR